MQEDFDFSSYASQVRALARTLMAEVRCASDISGRMHLLTTAVERDLRRFGEPLEASRVACGPGCSACCVVNVEVLVPEAITIAWYLQRWLSPRKLCETCDRLEELHMRTRWLDDEERLFVGEPCAFLDEQGWCTIHAVRPLLCRSITSHDAQACHEAIAMIALDGPPVVEMRLFQKRLMDTAYAQLGLALQDLELDHRSRRLSAAVLCLLTKPEMVRRFISGQNLPLH